MEKVFNKLLRLEKRIGEVIFKDLFRDLFACLIFQESLEAQSSAEFLEWTSANIIDVANEYSSENNLLDSDFIQRMGKIFDTEKFRILMQRLLVDYILMLFRIFAHANYRLVLEDNPLNRFLFEKYSCAFKTIPGVRWIKERSLLHKIVCILLQNLSVFYLSLNRGIKIFGKKKKFKVMREALWGLYGIGGYYMHDDFVVDGNKIKADDLVLFSRGYPSEEGRLKGYKDLRKSPYSYFNMKTLPVSLRSFCFRIIPKYMFFAGLALFGNIKDKNFSLYSTLFFNYYVNSLPYEKIFSNYEVGCELAHNAFSYSHVPEAIVCQNYGVKYYFYNWSDLSIDIAKYHISYPACDKYFLWGRAQIKNIVTENNVCEPIGYLFKKFIMEIKNKRDKVLADMNINKKGKIISFFDESFGGKIKMTEGSFINFWETILKFAKENAENTILVKPKGADRWTTMSDCGRKRFEELKSILKNMNHVYIVDDIRWSFVECIGIADVVVTQGMTSSAGIAIISGIEGLYFDEVHYNHPFSMALKDIAVFDSQEKFLNVLNKIVKENKSVLKDIPNDLIRSLDEYDDDLGIERLRDILVNSN